MRFLSRCVEASELIPIRRNCRFLIFLSEKEGGELSFTKYDKPFEKSGM